MKKIKCIISKMSSKTKSQRKGGFSLFPPKTQVSNVLRGRESEVQPQSINMTVNNVPVELFFIRHAHSCANMIEAYGTKGLKKGLTLIGLEKKILDLYMRIILILQILVLVMH